jgi:gas vesicle protein
VAVGAGCGGATAFSANSLEHTTRFRCDGIHQKRLRCALREVFLGRHKMNAAREVFEVSTEEKRMSDNDSGVGGFGWFLAGLGIGALVGVLYAPKSGKETRDDLVAASLEARDKASQLYSQGIDQAGQYVQQGKQAATQYVQQGKQVASDYVEQGKQAVGEYVDKGKEYYDKGRTQWSQYVDKGKQVVQNQSEAVTAAVEAGKEAYVAKTTETQPS